MEIIKPEPRHVPALIQLSSSFAGENEWAAGIPIGQICTPQAAGEKLVGSDVLSVCVAESEDGSLAGYIGVYAHAGGAHASILIARKHRRSGLGRKLVEAAFAELPHGIKVEAWVGEFNAASQSATPKMGFHLDRTIEDNGHKISIFVRET